MKQKIFLTFVSLGLVASFALGTNALAQEVGVGTPDSQESVMEEGTLEVSVSSVSVEEQKASLDAIAQQLQSIEEEVNQLSLRVSKYVLEQQALALQRQVEAFIAAESSGAALPPVAVGSGESVPADSMDAEGGMMEDEAVAMEEGTVTPVQPVPAPAPSQDNSTVGRSNVSNELAELPAPAVSSNEDEGKGQGFFAGIREAVGGLGTPELVTVFILAVLAIFVIVRRITSREKKQAPKPQPISSTSSPSTGSQGGQQQALDEQRQELQERVAWK